MTSKAGNIPKTPVTVIFGAKAAPAYTIAKDIIHLILTLSKVIEADKDVSPYLKVVLVQNYNVTLAEKLIHDVIYQSRYHLHLKKHQEQAT